MSARVSAGPASRSWTAQLEGLELRSLAEAGLVYHAGSGSTYVLPRASVAMLELLECRGSLGEAELGECLAPVAEGGGGAHRRGGDGVRADPEALWAILGPLLEAGLVVERMHGDGR